MIKVQNLAPYPIETPTGLLEPAQTTELECLDAVAGLISAGLLAEVEPVDASEDKVGDGSTKVKSHKRNAKADNA